jgi:hypothetical protein
MKLKSPITKFQTPYQFSALKKGVYKSIDQKNHHKIPLNPPFPN